MALNIAKEITAMKQMTVDELRAKFAEVFGETTPGRHKDWLIKRIAWRLQALAEGGLSVRARRRAAELANDADLRAMAPAVRKSETTTPRRTVTRATRVPSDGRLPLPGTIITRVYKGRTLEVKVLREGFEFEGEVYKSLSAVAKAITRTHWNGYHFFGLKKKDVAP